MESDTVCQEAKCEELSSNVNRMTNLEEAMEGFLAEPWHRYETRRHNWIFLVEWSTLVRKYKWVRRYDGSGPWASHNAKRFRERERPVGYSLLLKMRKDAWRIVPQILQHF